jgi:threonine dehydrogenase-like Zn-dependent dehydrogenase
MLAAQIAAPGQIEMQCVNIPEPGPGQVRVRLEGCGVCASNIPVWEGKPWFEYPIDPGAPGHEGWGRIDAVGAEVSGFSPGDRVAMLSGHAYAQYDIAPATSVLKLPPEFDKAPFPGEPLGCAMNIFRRSGIRANSTVAIVGIGFLGAILTRLASEAGARVIAVSRRPDSLAFAERMGACKTACLDDENELRELVRSATDGRQCEVVIEATGKQRPLDLAAEFTCERGRLVIAGYHQDGPRQIDLQLWNWRGLDVINAHERDTSVYVDGMRLAIDAVQRGILDPSPLFTHKFPLNQLGDALNMTAQRPPGFMKAWITL